MNNDEIYEWMWKNLINPTFEVLDDGNIVILDDMILKESFYKEIKNITFKIIEVKGDIIANECQLEDLNWLPKMIGGSLLASNNLIQEFKCESKIGYSIYLRNNKIRHLEIENVGSNLDISNNPIEFLKIGYVKNNFKFRNTKIYDIEEMPIAERYIGIQQIKDIAKYIKKCSDSQKKIESVLIKNIKSLMETDDELNYHDFRMYQNIYEKDKIYEILDKNLEEKFKKPKL